MSTDLSVKLNRPIETGRLVRTAETTMRELLALLYTPTLNIKRVEAGIRHIVTSELIEKKQMFVVGMEGHREEVAVVVHEIPQHPSIPEDEVGLWTGVTVGAMRTPLEYAMAAAVAIALAREVKADVIDDALLWNRIEAQKPDDFLKAIKVCGEFEDIHSAAEAMYTAAPVGQYRKKLTS
jgi:hypothetical protein